MNKTAAATTTKNYRNINRYAFDEIEFTFISLLFFLLLHSMQCASSYSWTFNTRDGYYIGTLKLRYMLLLNICIYVVCYKAHIITRDQRELKCMISSFYIIYSNILSLSLWLRIFRMETDIRKPLQFIKRKKETFKSIGIYIYSIILMIHMCILCSFHSMHAWLVIF